MDELKRIKKMTRVGGQALIEGIMMKGPEKTCTAIRKPDGEIHTEVTATRKNKLAKVPVVRGVVAMVNNLTEGYASITKSADIAFPDAQEDEGKFDRFLREKLGDKAGTVIGLIGGVLGAVLAVALFMVLPTLITGLLARFLPLSGAVKAIMEGVLKIGIFVLYLYLVTRIKDIHRVFEYHGAEHKTINCFENLDMLTVENVRRSSRFHPRCGTSFIFIVFLVSILVFAFIPWQGTLARVGLKLLALPLIMGVSYEIIMFAGAHDNGFCRALSAPGKWVQRLTTFEPDDGQIEVAITAFKEAEPDWKPPYRGAPPPIEADQPEATEAPAEPGQDLT